MVLTFQPHALIPTHSNVPNYRGHLHRPSANPHLMVRKQIVEMLDIMLIVEYLQHNNTQAKMSSTLLVITKL